MSVTGSSTGKKQLTLTADRLQVEVGEKRILHDVSIEACSGKLMAIMGPSGGGKTTLLNAIAGRMPIQSGSVSLNGRSVSPRMRKNFGYVTQMDVFFPSLTLRQVLQFAARVKLPDSMTEKQRHDRMMEVVHSLELDKCIDTNIGSAIFPGLSGGEKKRANIACELLRNPKVLLLDEPTSGLDASLALTLIMLLRRWAAEQQRIVVMSIHQPSSQIFFSFQDLLLLADGHVAFFGRRDGMVPYFEQIQVPFRKHWNAADYMLEIVKHDSKHKDHIIKEGAVFSDLNEMRKITSASSLRQLQQEQQQEANDEAVDIGQVNAAFSNEEEEEKEEEAETKQIDEALAEVEAGQKVSWWRQLAALTIRGFHLARMRFLSPFPIIQTVFVGLISSLLWFQIPRIEERFGDIIGCVFFLVITLSFMPLFDAITSFNEDAMIVRHERRAGMYQIGAYYLSKMLTEMPLVVAVPFVILTIVYFAAALGTAAFYVPFVFGILINAMACQGIGLFIGLITDSPKINMTIAFVFMMFSMLFGGFFSTAVPAWLTWAKWLSFIRYCYHYSLQLAMEGSADFQCATAVRSQYPSCQRSPADSNATLSLPAQEILANFPDQFIPIWANFLVILLFLFLFRGLGYVLLRFRKKI